MGSLMNAKRVVFKVGTSTLAYRGGGINLRRVEKLVRVLSDLKNQGKDIVLVSSGAIGVGMGKLGLRERPRESRFKQALAAIGQCELMDYYSELFSGYNHNVAQLLLTKDIMNDETRRNNAIATFETLFEYGVIPIVNENDSVSTEQIEFGDNDTLSAHVAKLIGAQMLIILSDIDGLYDGNPNNTFAHLISKVDDITDDIRSVAGGAGSTNGTGGMITKIAAAEIFTRTGGDMFILNGNNPDIIYDLLDGEKVGTFFKGRNNGD